MKKSPQTHPAAFTLIEILVVLAIIGLLSTLAVAALQVARAKAKTSAAQSDVKLIVDAIQMLGNDTNLWPGEQAVGEVGTAGNNEICGEDINGENCGAQTLAADSSGLLGDNGNYSNWNGPYLRQELIDPWDREYFFDTDYSVDINGDPCGCGGGGCVDAVVVGSYGPDQAGKPVNTATGGYGCDDIIYILYK